MVFNTRPTCKNQKCLFFLFYLKAKYLNEYYSLCDYKGDNVQQKYKNFTKVSYIMFHIDIQKINRLNIVPPV